MKKTLIMLGILLMTSSVACAAQRPPMGPPMGPPPCEDMGPCGHRPEPPRIDLDKKLKLTDAQKAKAKELRMSDEKQIRPLFEQLQQKSEEKRALLNSNINKKEQIEMIDNLNNQISSLKKQIRDIKIQNAKDFEAILTPKQLKTLDKLKQQARKNMCKKHHKRGGFGFPPMPPKF